MRADKATVHNLLQNKIEIPFFQRSYVWGKENCETLLEDIDQSIEKNQQLFLGCVVLKEIEKFILDAPKIQLIDGQQRITTLSILLKVISLLNKDCEPEFNKFFSDSKYNVKHNHYDANAFDEVINKNKAEPLTGNSKIYATFNLYLDKLKHKSDLELKNLYKYITNSIIVIVIDVNKDEDEQKIFDSLNSLGVRLTTAELLKNYLFNSQNPEDVELFEHGWTDIEGKKHIGWKDCFEKDEDTKKYWDAEITHGRIKRSNIDLLLHSFLSIQSINSSSVYSKLDNLFDSYKTFLKGKNIQFKHDIIKGICSLSEAYKKSINYEIASMSPQTDIERLNLLLFAGELTTVIPYFVYLLSDYNDNKQDVNKMCKYIEGYLLRRFVTDASAKNYNNLFASMIREKINTVSKFMSKVKDKAETNGIPTDEEVRKKICKTEFKSNEEPKILLYLLESFLNDEKTTLTLREYGGYELEHIMPKKWQEHWSDVNANLPDYIVQQHIYNIGNMTLLTSSLNKAIKNKSWNIKLNGQTINHKQYNGYKKYVQGVYIFDQKYLQQEQWTTRTIETRALEIAEKIITNWPL